MQKCYLLAFRWPRPRSTFDPIRPPHLSPLEIKNRRLYNQVLWQKIVSTLRYHSQKSVKNKKEKQISLFRQLRGGFYFKGKMQNQIQQRQHSSSSSQQITKEWKLKAIHPSTSYSSNSTMTT